MTKPHAPSSSNRDARTMVGAVYRAESRRVFATLIRLLGDFDAAEEALHEAFRVALEQWPCDGVPENPRAWLVSAGRFRAIDNIRRNARFDTLDENAAENIEASEVADANDIEDGSRRLGKRPEARAAYQCALKLIQLEPEQRFLERRLAELGQ
jgi:RNA polymerase sigma-70 factor, ECF subfamily